MAVKERSQIKGTDAQIKAFAGHNGVLAFATDTKSLHVLSGTAGTTTEFLPSSKVATKTELANYTPTSSLATVATSGSYNDLSDKPVVDSALSETSENPVQNKVINSALDGKLSTSGGTVTGNLTVNDLSLNSGRINGLSHDVGMLLNYFCGGGEGEGAWLALSGKSSNVERDRGGWRLKAGIPGGSNHYFSGFSDGSLELDGQSIGHLVAKGKTDDGTKWYRKYADGFIEQGGCLSLAPTDDPYYSINFLIPFTNTNYCGFVIPALNDSTAIVYAATGYARSTTGLSTYLPGQVWPVAGMSAYYVNFFACGF